MFFVRNWPFFQLLFFRQYRPGKCVLKYSRTKKTLFQAIKTRSSKSRKIAIIPKGLTHGFCTKMAIFPSSFFLGNMGQKNAFYDILEQKKPFQAKKTKSSKSRKIDIFPKGLTHGFGPKMAIFSSSFFQAKKARKMSFTIFQNKKTTFQAIKTGSSKSRKIAIFSKGLNHRFLDINGHFFQLLFFRQNRPGNVFYDILERRNVFLGYKNNKFQKSKNCHFSMVQVQKWPFIQVLFIRQYRPG